MKRWTTAGLAAIVLPTLVLTGVGAVSAPADGAPTPSTRAGDTYRNPVHGEDAGFADPSVIRGRDGYFYAYGTGKGIPIIRSRDLVSWEPVGHVVTDDNRPSWIGPDSGNWAPDITAVDGEYVLTFTIAGTPVAPKPNRAVGVATAPSPAGPWTLPGDLLLEPKMWHPTPNAPESFRSIMDSDAFTAPDGTRYLYFGGFRGGIYVVELGPDGTTTVGEPVKLASEHSYEAAHVVFQDGWYHLMVSSGGCCAGPVSGYQVLDSRSRSPLGPFTDRDGVPLLGRTPGGTPVVSATGNRWVGPGHHTVVTDLGGQDWFVYHAIDRTDPYREPPPNRQTVRPMMLDRLDWVDGWPVLRGGLGASDEQVPAPVTDAPVADAFEPGALGQQWRGGSGWSVVSDSSGSWARSPEPDEESTAGAVSTLTSRRTLAGYVRVRGVVRAAVGTAAGVAGVDGAAGAAPDGGSGDSGAFGVGLVAPGARGGVRAVVDRAERALLIEQRGEGDAWRVAGRAALPDSFVPGAWHEIELRSRDGSVTATVSDAGQHDPVATAQATVQAPPVARVQAVAVGAAAEVDDVTAAPLAGRHDDVVPEPSPGVVDEAFSDEFDAALDDAWTWVREPGATVADGRLHFPVQDADLTGNSNDASLLLRDVPDGTWTAETAVTADFGEPDGYPQAGLVAYAHDDLYLRLTARGHGAPVLTAFQKEMPYGDGTVANAATFGAGEPTTYLRLRHTLDPATGEHLLRAASSTDGATWTWATTYVLPADADLRIGLAAHGGEPVDATFDYFRVRTPV